ncbi:M23 family metallopeptidase [Helicobacter pametensis]|uniref:M23 family metallopeptidase n=1 Tax=Helicobacter pametensis TaxID=95149 RepID=UPI0004AE829C|nr:M23 family metallopeptidase [Helicobacter pametensis]
MGRVRGYRRKRSYRGFFIFLFFAAIIALVYFASKSDIFEQRMPEIQMPDVSYWNPKREMPIVFRDENSIKEYSIIAFDHSGSKVLDIKEVVLDKPKEVKINLPIPKLKLQEGERLHYVISVTDWSNANFFSGNTQKKELNLVIDSIAPKVDVLASSFAITYGGSALIVFKAEDENLKNVVFSNGVDEFKPFPYIAKGYYAVLVAWPIKNTSFSPTIIATDYANNQTKYRVAIVKRTKGYRKSTLKLQEKNFDQVHKMLLQIGKRDPNSFANGESKFKYLNEEIRSEDESEIYQASNSFQIQMIDHPLVFERFYPLKGGQVVGSFGDARHYIYKEQNISNSFHLGLDVASTKHAPILLSNAGKVILEKKLGLYGNTIVMYHALGLASSYSHISKFNSKLGDFLQSGSILAYTGSTGWAFGDHLHFGIIVQGHFVRIAEWMDSRWIKNNITNVLQKGEKIIKGQMK